MKESYGKAGRVQTKERPRRAAPLNPMSRSQARRLIALEVRIVYAEQEAFQPPRFAEDVTRYTLPFRLKKVG